MSRVAIMVDSAAGVDPAFAAEHDLHIVPLLIQMQGQTLRDGVDITPEELYALMPTCSPLPTTSQTPIGDLIQAYRSLESEGYDGVVSMHLSSGMSSACATARMAANEVSIPVEIVDTLCAASGSLFAVEAAVRAAERNADLKGIAEAARHVAATQRTIFAVDTLEYLHKGGRVSGSAAFIGSVLQVKPLLHFVDGRMVVLERVRTSARVLRRLVEVMVEWVGAETPVLARVIHAAAPDSAQQLADLAQEALNVVNMRMGVVPAVLGAHSGPGTLSLCCLPIADAGL